MTGAIKPERGQGWPKPHARPDGAGVHGSVHDKAGGVGVAIVPARAPPHRAIDRNLVWRPLVRPRLSSEIGIIRLRDRELSPAAAGLLALARERLRIRRSAQR